MTMNMRLHNPVFFQIDGVNRGYKANLGSALFETTIMRLSYILQARLDILAYYTPVF